MMANGNKEKGRFKNNNNKVHYYAHNKKKFFFFNFELKTYTPNSCI